MPDIRRTTALPALLGGLVLSLLALAGCTLTRAEIPPPTPTVTPAPEPVSEGGWEMIRPGIERRMATITTGSAFNAAAVIVRIDPAQATFHVGYRPGEPLSLNDLRAPLPGAAAIVNGPFFPASTPALARCIRGGQVIG